MPSPTTIFDVAHLKAPITPFTILKSELKKTTRKKDPAISKIDTFSLISKKKS
jgi:hypothetical protein